MNEKRLDWRTTGENCATFLNNPMHATTSLSANNRDGFVLGIFLTVDDALQGISALHTYTTAIHEVATRSISVETTATTYLQITHEWSRQCSLADFVQHMQNSFEFMHCRSSLLSMVAAFEIALQRFKERLWDLNLLGSKGSAYVAAEYKHLLNWAFQQMKNPQCGSSEMRQRLPEVCGDVDNARRLRNLSLHNNNKYAPSYVDDAIDNGWVKPQFIPR
jgi:hypothetical protein